MNGPSLHILKEFIRYALVGGIAFVCDFATLVVLREFAFHPFAWGVYAATAAGFLVGLCVNYRLSLAYVFTDGKDRGKGRSAGAFLTFGVVGAFGLLWTELGMWAGVEGLGANYVIVKIVVTGLVLLWNYLGRKILVFNGKVGQS